jgi:hypothetical protein
LKGNCCPSAILLLLVFPYFVPEINGENLNNVRCEASRHFRNKKREYLKGNINELATNSKNKTSDTRIEK